MNPEQLIQALKSNQLHPIKRFGQHFLIHQKTIRNIVNKVKKHPPFFVEIGPGLGALTQHFKTIKQHVVLIERDKKLAAYWKKRGYLVFPTDVLKLNWNKLPKRFTLFGNLPYEVVAGIIFKACLHQNQVRTMVIMMQKEQAERVRAQPGGKTYGFFSVVSQIFWNISLVTQVPKTYFYPSPKVEGQVLEFHIQHNRVNFGPSFLKFVKKCFSFKRKMLFKQMEPLSFSEAKQILKCLKLSETCRAEELLPSQFVKLYLKINSHLK